MLKDTDGLIFGLHDLSGSVTWLALGRVSVQSLRLVPVSVPDRIGVVHVYVEPAIRALFGAHPPPANALPDGLFLYAKDARGPLDCHLGRDPGSISPRGVQVPSSRGPVAYPPSRRGHPTRLLEGSPRGTTCGPYVLGGCEMWCASTLNLCLKYWLKTVDLVRLKRMCTVNDGRAKRDPSRNGGGDLLKVCGSSPTPIVLRRRGHRERSEGGQDVETLTCTTRARRGWQFRGGDNSRLQRREVRPARGRACGCGVVRLDGRVASPSL